MGGRGGVRQEIGATSGLQVGVSFLKKHYEAKVRGVLGGDGPGGGHIIILNRKLSWKGNAMSYEADERHAERIRDEMGVVEMSKGLDKPFVREGGEQGDGWLSASEVSLPRAGCDLE